MLYTVKFYIVCIWCFSCKDDSVNAEHRIRILHIVQAAGGVERYLQLLMKYFEEECFENILVYFQNYCVDSFKENVFQVEQIKMY